MIGTLGGLCCLSIWRQGFDLCVIAKILHQVVNTFMQKLLFIFLLMPTLVTGQRVEWDSAYLKSLRTDGFGTPLAMPEIDYNPDFNIEEQFHPRQRQMYYPVRSDSVYRKIFYQHIYTADSVNKYEQKGADAFTLVWIKKYQRDSIPEVDFDTYNLVVYSACGQCLANCKHNTVDESCHRNACQYRYTWFKVFKPIKLSWD